MTADEEHPIETARRLRRGMTPSERLLWDALRDRRLDGWKFRRQHPVDGYVVDFYCPQRKLAIEVDGGVHRRRPAADAARQELLEAQGIRFVRVAADVAEHYLASVLETIRSALETSSRTPSS